MTYINMTEFVLITWSKKDHGMLETRCLKNVVVFIQAILSFALSRKILILHFRILVVLGII